MKLISERVGLESVEKRLDFGDAGFGGREGECRSVVVFQVDDEHGRL